ncbi:Auxin Efflux Carrier [Bifidobacterium actinocoloniiforme DSM 22766]|uniref:Auxin Efflux Carrier n=1 Tax=Bifidobacterium actinocoloniiforme DSM 22766 TaxID=1437605 RepID=A0A086YYM6_9BIFI|nr:AEC family transporter [Bifidobacterium actinocoloniiforme]AKV55900.1 malate transporter [Bifidobacterium actinocoloniiforme DSM 22766]KFI39376.1 Auxin Efflux Carrier [Bifidobacterium actinocoloniiforme DSM 22766]
MLITVIFALLPILVAIMLGMFAAKRGHFSDKDSSMLIKFVMTYALPMHVFGGIWKTPRKLIIEDIPLALWMLGSMFVCFIVLTVIYVMVLKADRAVSTLRALSVADPSIPFIGSAVLPLLFSASESAIVIGIASLIINVILLPFVFTALADKEDTNAPKINIGQRLKKSLTKPLVIAAFLGFALALAGLQMPKQLDSTFTVLGKTAGGVAMFATGIVLVTRKISFNKNVFITVFLKNLAFPLVIWGLMAATGMPGDLTRIVVVTMSIPTATMPTNLAIEYQINESEMASTQFLSTILSFITLSAAMLLLS